jgi:hypothetical protein
VEPDMNKLLIAVAATLLAIPTLFGSPAEAGGKHGFHRAFHHFLAVQALHSRDREYRSEKSYRAKRHVKRKVHVAKKAEPKPVSVAKVESETVSKVSEMENSSISTVDGAVAAVETDELEKVAEVRDVGCKKFFPSAGMTLSVPCE